MSKPGIVRLNAVTPAFQPRSAEPKVQKASASDAPGATQVFNDPMGRYSWVLISKGSSKKCVLTIQPSMWTMFCTNGFFKQLLPSLTLDVQGSVVTVVASKPEDEPSKYVRGRNDEVHDPVGDFLTILGLHMMPPIVKRRSMRPFKEPVQSPVPVYGQPVSANFRANPTAKLPEPEKELEVVVTTDESMTFEQKLQLLATTHQKKRGRK